MRVCVCVGVRGYCFQKEGEADRKSLEEEVASAWALKDGDSLDAQGEDRRATAGKTVQTGPGVCLGHGILGENATWSL